MRNVRNATQALADPLGIRSVIIRTILDSGSVSLPEKEKIDAAEWIADRFRALLFRDPSPTSSRRSPKPGSRKAAVRLRSCTRS